MGADRRPARSRCRGPASGIRSDRPLENLPACAGGAAVLAVERPFFHLPRNQP